MTVGVFMFRVETYIVESVNVEMTNVATAVVRSLAGVPDCYSDAQVSHTTEKTNTHNQTCGRVCS